jgi:hypothetical protein
VFPYGSHNRYAETKKPQNSTFWGFLLFNMK